MYEAMQCRGQGSWCTRERCILVILAVLAVLVMRISGTTAVFCLMHDVVGIMYIAYTAGVAIHRGQGTSIPQLSGLVFF